MAQSDSADVSSGSAPTWLERNVDNLVGWYAQIKMLDAETNDDTNNIPDENDLVHNVQQQAASDPLGGTFSRTIGGLKVSQWGIIGGGLVAGLIVLKKAKVI